MDPLASLRQAVEELPRERLPEAAGALAEAQAALQIRLQEDGSSTPESDAEDAALERLLDVDEAAEMLNVDTRWLYRRADTLPFTRKLSARTLRFSERGILRWLETRT